MVIAIPTTVVFSLIAVIVIAIVLVAALLFPPKSTPSSGRGAWKSTKTTAFNWLLSWFFSALWQMIMEIISSVVSYVTSWFAWPSLRSNPGTKAPPKATKPSNPSNESPSFLSNAISFFFKITKLAIAFAVTLTYQAGNILAACMQSTPFLVSTILTVLCFSCIYVFIPLIKGVKKRSNYALVAFACFVCLFALTASLYSNIDINALSLSKAEVLLDELKARIS